MTFWIYIVASLRQHRRIHLAVAAGVAVTTAVITGALIVGTSVRGSLYDLAIGGLGRIDSMILGEHPFRAELADELLANPEVGEHFAEAVPLLLARGAATFHAGEKVRRATGLDVVGAPPEFWTLGLAAPQQASPLAHRNDLALTKAVAEELGAKVGDSVLLRLPQSGSAPADSTLGEREEAVAARRMKLAAILDDGDLNTMARFRLRPSQQTPRNAFLTLGTLQELLELEGQATAVALAVEPGRAASAIESPAIAVSTRALRPHIEDFGVKVETIERGGSGSRYVRVSGDRLVLQESVVEAARKAGGKTDWQPAITYLANAIVAGDRRIPYSTVTGVDSTKQLGPLLNDDGQPVELADDEIALNDWAASDLNVAIGDEVVLTWYDPETTHGELRELPPLSLRLRAIVPLANAAGEPTSAADPHFAPELPGVTDQRSIDQWKLPFELVEDIRDKDEEYWEKYRTTPKAFVSHALATKLWKTRWGTESILRRPLAEDQSATSIANDLRQRLDPARLGLTVVPMKSQVIAAASGTTPFDGLFLGFSFFLMASAIMLTALLFRLGVEQRANEVGLLYALGMAPHRVRRLLLVEAAFVAAVGAIVGAAAGVAYARLMIHGLNTWWVQATSAPFLRLHADPKFIAIGGIVGLLVALTTLAMSLRHFSRLPLRQLLAGDAQSAPRGRGVSWWSHTVLPAACLAIAAGLGVAAVRWEGEVQAGAFFGSGALVLIGILALVRAKLREPRASQPTSLTLSGLALRNARRNPGRTMLSVALAATASFLIVALSAFRMAPTERGTGGFDLIANSDLPLHYDLNSSEGRRQLGFTQAEIEQLRDTEIVSFRVRDGEDASCLNLYQTTQPRILGAPSQLAENSRFQWGAFDDGLSGKHKRAGWEWNLLEAHIDEATAPSTIPMVVDRNTAMYSLKLYRVGARLPIRDASNRDVNLQVVGMLVNSILQGDVILGESNFLQLFPETAGRRFFLVRRGPAAPPTAELASLLESRLEDYGFDVVDARERLAQLMAVQNTYLSTFQSLGALGLLLGAVGLAVAQARNVLERRGELALMQATGFRRGRLLRMVLVENLLLLAGGLAIGTAAAVVALAPHTLLEQVGVPWGTLAMLLATAAIAGAAAAWVAARAALMAPLLPALRGD